MSDLFQRDFFAGNRERLKQLFTGTAPIIVAANGLLQKNTDEAYPFKQDASFWYLTGCDDPDVVLVMDRHKEYLIVPTRGVVRLAFDGAVDFDALKRRSGISDIVDEKEGWHRLEKRLKKVKNVATLAAYPNYIDNFGLYANPSRAALIHQLKTINGDIDLLDLRPHLARMRMVKQEPELEAIQQAVDITIATIKSVTRRAKRAKYDYEYELEADITRGFRKRGATGHSFSPVVASGPRTCVLHHVTNDSAIEDDDLVIVDIGTDYEHYSSDIARTFNMSGVMSHRETAVYDAVCEAQDYAFSLLKPGVKPREYEKQLESFIGEKLRELNLIKTITSKAVRAYFPHATSHFLGLDTHDAGDYDHPLEPGVVLAVEPGIYIPQEGIGIRIEDDVVITESGIKNISGRLPR